MNGYGSGRREEQERRGGKGEKAFFLQEKVTDSPRQSSRQLPIKLVFVPTTFPRIKQE